MAWAAFQLLDCPTTLPPLTEIREAYSMNGARFDPLDLTLFKALVRTRAEIAWKQELLRQGQKPIDRIMGELRRQNG